MDDKHFPPTENTNTEAHTPSADQASPVSPSQPAGNKKLLMAVLAGIAALLLILIVLLAMLLAKKDDSAPATDADTSTQSSKSASKQESNKDIMLVVASSDEKLEYVVYKPKQNPSNTTINFGVRSACEGCDNAINVYEATNGFNNKTTSYLIDDNLGKKYSTIKDEDGEVLATPNCYGSIKKGETLSCFVSFTKVPSGSTVSWVFGKNRIDGIKIQ